MGIAKCIYTHAGTHAHMYVCMHTHVHAAKCLYIHGCMHTHVCLHGHTCARIHLYIYILIKKSLKSKQGISMKKKTDKIYACNFLLQVSEVNEESFWLLYCLKAIGICMHFIHMHY